MIDTSKEAMERALSMTGATEEEFIPPTVKLQTGGKIEIYRGNDLKRRTKKQRWLIEGWLRYGDVWLIKAQKKKGKSVLIQQIAFNLTTGENFLSHFPIHKKCKVLILASEMVHDEWAERIENMEGLYPMIGDSLILMRCYCVKLTDHAATLELLDKILDLGTVFDVIIIDPMYRFFGGGDSLSSDVAATSFADNVDYLKSELGATIIEVHHDSEKKSKDKRGNEYDVADPETTLGSSFLGGNATHVTTLLSSGKGKNTKHQLVTPTERSGGQIKEMSVRMVIPQVEHGKLGFVPNDGCNSATDKQIVSFLREYGEGTREQICYDKEIPDGTFIYAMNGNSAGDRKCLIGKGIVEVFKKSGKGNLNYYRLTEKYLKSLECSFFNDEEQTEHKVISKVQREIGYGK